MIPSMLAKDTKTTGANVIFYMAHLKVENGVFVMSVDVYKMSK